MKWHFSEVGKSLPLSPFTRQEGVDQRSHWMNIHWNSIHRTLQTAPGLHGGKRSSLNSPTPLSVHLLKREKLSTEVMLPPPHLTLKCNG